MSKLNITERWHIAAKSMGIPPEGYNTKIKIVKDLSSHNLYTFGIILNSYRYTRPQDPDKNNLNCPLCNAVRELQVIMKEY